MTRTENIVEIAQTALELSILVQAAVAADLIGALSTGSLTVFAPANTAFAAPLVDLGVSKAALLVDKTLVTKVLTYNLLPKRVLKAEGSLGKPIIAVQGESFTVGADLNITDQLNGVTSIVAADVVANTGVIHTVGRVLLPA